MFTEYVIACQRPYASTTLLHSLWSLNKHTITSSSVAHLPAPVVQEGRLEVRAGLGRATGARQAAYARVKAPVQQADGGLAKRLRAGASW